MHIIIYSTPNCPFCKQAKAFLNEKQAAFTEIDVSTDNEKAQEMIKKTGQMGVPVIIVKKDNESEEVVVGFDRERLAKILGSN